MKALALLAVAALLLAGCTDGKRGDDDTASSTSSSASASRSGTASASRTGTSSGTGTGTGSPGAGTIEVDFTRATPNGAAPLTVNFTLDATFRDAKGAEVPAPAGATWAVTVHRMNGTTLGNATPGPTGNALPAAFNLTFTAGDHAVLARVQGTGFGAGNASILVTAAGGGAPLFFDGAEGDASQFTITSNVLLTNIAPAPSQELAAAHPTKWSQVTDAAHTGTKSWSSHYPDNYRSRLTTIAITVPAGGASLSYWAKGGAESNGIDGLHVLVNGAEVALHNAVPDWTQFTHAVPAGELKVEFRFDSDSGCSDDTPGPAGDPSGQVCGGGFDQGGLLLDDIQVA